MLNLSQNSFHMVDYYKFPLSVKRDANQTFKSLTGKLHGKIEERNNFYWKRIKISPFYILEGLVVIFIFYF